ncbi:hypothetical protein VSS74_13810 [Conexibacter stalactiti]|uniref:Peptidase S9 prolyl oligopeptidase catalytic domain-containing protein n=1 Tax=Conexibacter stalactiti TaxID=1940611 RepID=A0ABU4HQ39_9ACTN|nr:hypothetical protein [Conexibacter stalactiti]MDW5595420.1 hypothetical protein [Conexibacter stalactiti]MEC5036062.1 hypothetical protein [Conexibacter stalactiti]
MTAAVAVVVNVADPSQQPGDGAVGLARPSAPAGFRYESGQLNEGPLRLRRVSFATADGRATGMLAVPPGRRAPMPAVVYLHGLGGDSADFAPEAIFAAAKGVVALSLDSADVGAPPLPEIGIGPIAEDARRRAATIERVRAGVAAIAARRDVDAERIAFVGFSRGAAVGALAAARIDGLAAEVYVSGAAGRATWPHAFDRLGSADRDRAQQLIARFDPARALASTPARPRLVQYGTADEVVPRQALRAFAAALPQPKRVTVVSAGRHALGVAELYARLQWLDRELRVAGPPVQGAPVLRRR